MGQLRPDAQYPRRRAQRAVRLSAALAGLFASGHAVDVVLAVMALEAALLIAVDRQRPDEVALLLLPGALFMLGLRAALVGAGWPWIALPLALAFPVHLADLAARRRANEKRRGRPRRS